MFEVKTMLVLDPDLVRGLVVQSAASVIAFCNQLHGPVDENSSLTTIGGVLDRHVPGLKPRTAADLLYSQVDLIYNWVEMMLDPVHEPWHPQPGDVDLITNALRAFQNWKERYVAESTPGSWSPSALVAQRDWTWYNYRFIAKFSP